MNGIKLAIAAAGVCGAAFVASATDYYLNNSPAQNVANTDAQYWSEGSPSGTKGEVGAPLDPDGNYFVTGDRMLRNTNMTFPGATLTVGSDTENRWWSRVTQDNGNMAYRDLRLLRGHYQHNEYLSVSGVVYDFETDGPVTVLSKAETPFAIYANYAYRLMRFTGTLTGEADVGLLIGAYYDPTEAGGPVHVPAGKVNSTAEFADASGYAGKITVYGQECETFGHGLSFGRATIPGSVEMMPWTRLSTRSANDDVTIANLTLHGGSSIKTAYDAATGTNGVITVSGSYQLTDGTVEVIVDKPPVAPLNSAGVLLPVLRVPFAAALDETDFTIATVDSYSAQGVLRVVADETAGTRTLCVLFRPYIELTVEDPGGWNDDKVYGSAMTNGACWADGLVPHADAAYQFHWQNLRTPDGEDLDYEFTGDELRVWDNRVANLILCCQTFTLKHLLWERVDNRSQLRIVKWRSPTIRGRITILEGANLNVVQMANSVFTVESEIDGAGNWTMTGTSGTGSPSATTVFAGLNTNWTGSIVFDQAARHDASYDFPNFNQRQILKFSDGRNLGGKLATFNAGALTLKGYTEVIPTAPATLAAEMNRGISVVDAAQFNIAEGCDLRCEWPVTLGGTLYKFGVGTLALGGSGLIVPAGGEGNRIVVSNGYVKAVSSDAFNGATLDFAANRPTGLKVDFVQPDASLRRYGLKNVATETPFAGDVNVSFDGVTDEAFVPGSEIKVGICTVQTKVADDVAKKLKVKRPKHAMWAAQVVREDDPQTGWTTFSLLDKESGLLMILK